MPNQAHNILEYYGSQSDITNPRDQVDFLDGLPRNVQDLCEIVRGIFLHVERAMQKGVKENKTNSGTYVRYVDVMLAQIRSMSDAPILHKRPEDKRLIGNCRDDSVLLCTLLRHLNIPARVRYGFSRYFAGIDPEFGANHVICEYWNTDENRWVLVDPGQDETLIKKNQLTFDPHDVPRDQFITAAQAWTLCRNSQADPDHFGFGPFAPRLKGRWYIQTELVHECAAFNKMELLLRDRWGLGDCWHEEHVEAENLALLDQVALCILEAQHTSTAQTSFSHIQALYQHDALRVPDIITCYKYDGTRVRFDLKRRIGLAD